MAFMLIVVGALLSIFMLNPIPFVVCLVLGLMGRKTEVEIRASDSGEENPATEAAAFIGWALLFIFLVMVAGVVVFGIATVGPGGV